MGHDTEAAYASSEVADIIMLNQNSFFGNYGTKVRGQYMPVVKADTSGHWLTV